MKITHTSLNRTYTYEVVESIPAGYRIWAIGKNMIDGYLPLYQMKKDQPDESGCAVDTDTLKAIRTDGAQTIMAACHFGPDSIRSMERYVKRYENSKTPYVMRRVSRMRAALPYMKELRWDEPETAVVESTMDHPARH